MTTKQLKELYATGEWICITEEIGKNDWCIEWDIMFDSAHVLNYKLIHKKHSEVLDHVLNGGLVKYKFWNGNEPVNDFILTYDDRYDYEIIKDKPQTETNSIHENEKAICCAKCGACEEECICHKPSLSGHYCLATKEHYDKLIKDGTPLNAHLLAGKPLSFKYLLVRQTITGFDEIPKAYQDKPMHLHNNEWVFGSLEHEPNHANFIKEVEKIMSEPKPAVERIELSEKYQDAMYRLETSEGAWIADDIQKYVSYLEANQKGNQ